MHTRQNISSGAKWEDIVGFSRAVKLGNMVEVAGTVAVDKDGVVGKASPYKQAKFIIKKIEKTLNQAGASLADVVRTRMFVTDITQWEDIAKAHKKYFKDIKPATTMVEVSSLIDSDFLVEMEVTAVISSV